MRCYTCEGNLTATQVEPGLHAGECAACHGIHIHLGDYRQWRSVEPEVEPPEPSSDAVLDNAKALLCVRCKGFMLKFRMANELENFIDFCPACDDVWLDGGEWSLLKKLGIEDSLAKILTEPWQRKLKRKLFHELAADRLRERFNHADIDKINSIAEWLKEHPEKEEIFRLLRARSETSLLDSEPS